MYHIISNIAMFVAGGVHLWIAPEHYAHAPAHGIAMAIIGLLQVGWAIKYTRLTTAGGMLTGVILSGGVIVLWACAHWIGLPFSGHAHSIDWSTIVTLIAELFALAALLYFGNRAAPIVWRNIELGRGRISLLGTAIVAGVLVWSMGMASSSLFSPSDEHADHAHDHDHGHEAISTTKLSSQDAAQPEGSDYEWALPQGFPLPRVPADNPMTAAKVELGRYLFYDERLSGNGTQSCGSCHLQSLAFADGHQLPTGSTGEMHMRNSPGLANVAYNATLTWANPILDELEKQIVVPMFGELPIELGITGYEAEVFERLTEDARYQELFPAAFPDDDDPFSIGNTVKALASFIRSMISGNSSYDQYVYAGDKSALSESARRGMNLFLSERFECHHCHGGFNFSGSTVHQNSTFVEKVFQNNGLYNIGSTGAYPQVNPGLHEFTRNEDDMGRFRPPSLRNVELTAPYMHDGSIATLEEVIQHYADGGRFIEDGEHAGDGRQSPYKSGFVPGFEITNQEANDLVNFLKSLTDEQFISDSRYSDPFVD